MQKWMLVVLGCFCLMGCMDDSRVAPVVNAWHQKEAASDFYIVRESDTIYSIAFAFDLDYRDLVKANNLIPPYPVSTGQRLIMTHRAPKQEVQKTMLTERTPVIVAQTEAQKQAEQSPETDWSWPAQGRVIGRFTTDPSGRKGLTIAGKLGQPVFASCDGRVVYSGDGVRGYGNLIIIKTGDHYLTAYAFNEQNLINVNDKVRAGQLIARMGQNDAGRSLLYFEVRYNGHAVDPMPYLSK